MNQLRITMAVLSLLLPKLASGQGHGYQPQVGQHHSDFVLPRIGDRTPVALSDFRGKKVLLIQFASW